MAESKNTAPAPRRRAALAANRQLQQEAKERPELLALLSAFKDDGELSESFAAPPVYVPSYQGSADDLAAQADFVYRTRRRLTLEMLRDFRQQLGIADLGQPLHTELIAAGFCRDGEEWLPARDYYAGALWPRYDRAKALADAGDVQAATQANMLLVAMRLQRFDEIDAEPRMPWVPISVLRAWLQEWTDAEIPLLVRENGLLQVEDSAYAQLKDVAGQRLSVAIGYINHDFTLFRPPAEKKVDPSTGEEESSSQALSRARLEYGERARKRFREFVAARVDLAEQVEEAYNRLFRGYVPPEYGTDELHIARWRGRIVLKPHQRAGAQRLIANLGGLLGFDVGVGKTYTGIATMAALRQIGRAKRPIIIVPNTIIWKWWKDILRALPDYRVVVIGSERYIGRGGGYTSRIDTPEERAFKWRQFQAGEFDVALVTFSTFARNRVRAESVQAWILETPALLRMIGLNARNLLAGVKESEEEDEAEGGGKAPKKRKVQVNAAAIEKAVGAEKAKTLTDEEREKIAEQIAIERDKAHEAENERLLKLIEGYATMSERERAIFKEAMERWVAERLEMSEEPDPGIYFEDLHCDLLILDEAQNMKNLWPVQPREGGVPKYLGAITEGSDRAWNFAIRAALVRKRTGGSGVVLLSATPAKNSPLEYFTLLGYVDGQAWSRLGITDPEVFIDRYLRLELRTIVGSDLKAQRRLVVVGFQNLDELRGVIGRYAEFRTAEEVGLKLPETQVIQLRVPMNLAQDAKYEAYLTDYEGALKRGARDPSARMKALGLLMRMALVAIHPELDSGWSWKNARAVRDPSCPKLLKIRELILAKPECGHIVFCDNVAVHFWLRMLLDQAGFPVARIAIFNADQTPNAARRQLLAEKFNGTPPVFDDQGNVEQEGILPEYDVVIANATAYEGIDLHVRTCQVYHVDLPWEPATLQQRNGRAVRQGNMQAVIRIYYLLSDRSMDAVRLSMILGKLGWMKDLLKSADRETNNPSAQAEMNPEELLLFLARDPEQAKAAIAQQKQLLADETKKRVRQQAWTSLRGLSNRAHALKRVKDEAERTQIHREMVELRGYLAQVPSETWPWFFLADLAQVGHPMLFGPDWVLPAEWRLWVKELGEGLETGELRAGTELGIRLHKDFFWHAVSVEKLESAEPSALLESVRRILSHATPEDYQADRLDWPSEQDSDANVPKLFAAIALLRTGDFDALGLTFASAGWRRGTWWLYGTRIIGALMDAPRTMAFRIPLGASTKDGVFELVYGDELRSRIKTLGLDPPSEVVPFTPEHFAAFVEAAITSSYKWTELNATALGWWGRPFPKGVLRDAETRYEVEVATPEGKKKVMALWQSPHFAITYNQNRGADDPNGPLYVVTHIKSGLAAGQRYRSVASARAAAQYLVTLEVNWDHERPNFSRVPRNLTAILNWIAEQAKTPTLDEIRKQAAV